MTEPFLYRLGKLPHKPDNRTLLLGMYLTPDLPAPPESFSVANGVQSWPMYANDRLGDCTCAASAHCIEVWTAEEGHVQAVQESDVVAMYEAITHGHDVGAVELDVLRWWRQYGLGGHRPFAFALVDRLNEQHIKQALMLFGGLYIGIQLPISAQQQTGPDKCWDVVNGFWSNTGAGSWGGHAVNVVSYDASGLAVVTWGQLQRMTWAFWRTYVDECWAILPAEWATTKPQIAGFDFGRFAHDLAEVGRMTK